MISKKNTFTYLLLSSTILLNGCDWLDSKPLNTIADIKAIKSDNNADPLDSLDSKPLNTIAGIEAIKSDNNADPLDWHTLIELSDQQFNELAKQHSQSEFYKSRIKYQGEMFYIADYKLNRAKEGLRLQPHNEKMQKEVDDCEQYLSRLNELTYKMQLLSMIRT
ncbi:MAG: hypothetical protein DBO98_04695 [Candidatus Liberibacter europaeus]|nr:hypothetical protein [Candidatus Liberibacter europaeus]